MPPRYEQWSYWNDRFQSESHFEWLGDGVYTILPHLLVFLMSHPTPPRLLHIGAGSSWLSHRVLDTYRGVYGKDVDASRIVNLDYSEEIVRQRLSAQVVDGSCGPQIQWIRADALQWKDLSSVLASWGDGEKNLAGHFEVILDKSTSDCIACVDDIALEEPTVANPLLSPFLEANPSLKIEVSPMEMLALNLACLTPPGAIWIALSFSERRFEFLLQATRLSKPSLHVSLAPERFWAVKMVDAVNAHPGVLQDGVHSPEIKHYVYVLERTSICV